jgi:hypothetical protein
MKRLAILVLAIGISSCSVTPETPAQKVFAATTGYDAALSVAVAYKRLPLCKEQTGKILCSDEQVVSTIQQADNVSFAGLKSAQNIVRDPKFSQDAKQAAATWAKEAANAFAKVVALLKVK